MPSPFPGMDPYLEGPNLWEGFHANLATEIQSQLNPYLRPKYVATLTPRVVYIELLSPVNKRRGNDAHRAYLRKRRDPLRTDINLMEVDLLRAGQRPPILTPLPDEPYFIFLHRGTMKGRVEIWPALLIDYSQPPPWPKRFKPEDRSWMADLLHAEW